MNVEHGESLQICKATDRYIYVFRFFFFFRFLSPIGEKKKEKRPMNRRLRRRETLTIYQRYGTMEKITRKVLSSAKKRSWNSWKIGIELYPFLRQTLNADSGQWLCNMHPLARCFSFRRIVKRHSNQKTSQMFRGFKSGGSALRCSSLNEQRRFVSTPSFWIRLRQSFDLSQKELTKNFLYCKA